MLAEICGLIALFSKDNAQRYHDFWDAEIKQAQRYATEFRCGETLAHGLKTCGLTVLCTSPKQLIVR